MSSEIDEMDDILPADGPLDRDPPKQVIRRNADTLRRVARTDTRLSERAVYLLNYAGLEVNP